jgi:hypothetical protein
MPEVARLTIGISNAIMMRPQEGLGSRSQHHVTGPANDLFFAHALPYAKESKPPTDDPNTTKLSSTLDPLPSVSVDVDVEALVDPYIVDEDD